MGDRPLRILHFVCGEYERGGMQKHVLELSAAQVSLGDTVALAAHPSFGKHLGAGVELVPMDTARNRRDPGLRADLMRAVEQFGPDVLHAHAGKASKVVSVRMPLACATVSTVHGLKKDLRAPAKFDRAIAVSGLAALRLPREQTRVVFNGVTPRAPNTARAGSLGEFFSNDDGSPVALAIGRLVPVKGFETAIRAWPRVRGVRLVIVGDGPERPRLARMIERFGLADRVALAGEIPDAGALLAGAAMLVAPSLREGFGYVVVEALQARVPVITTTTSGAAAVLPQAWLMPPKRPKRLTAIVNAMSASPRGAASAFEDAFARAAAEFTVAGMAQRTRAVYIEAIGGRAGRRSV